VTDDRQLQELVGRARDMLQGVAADDLRTSGDMRARVKRGMASLAVDLDGMLIKVGGRRMRTTDEELAWPKGSSNPLGRPCFEVT